MRGLAGGFCCRPSGTAMKVTAIGALSLTLSPNGLTCPNTLARVVIPKSGRLRRTDRRSLIPHDAGRSA